MVYLKILRTEYVEFGLFFEYRKLFHIEANQNYGTKIYKNSGMFSGNHISHEKPAYPCIFGKTPRFSKFTEKKILENAKQTNGLFISNLIFFVG